MAKFVTQFNYEILSKGEDYSKCEYLVDLTGYIPDTELINGYLSGRILVNPSQLNAPKIFGTSELNNGEDLFDKMDRNLALIEKLKAETDAKYAEIVKAKKEYEQKLAVLSKDKAPKNNETKDDEQKKPDNNKTQA